MGHATKLHQATRPGRAAATRAAAERTNPRPAATPAPSPLIPLQRSLGNRAVGRLVQARLRVGRPGDRFEREADRVADEVMRAPEPDAAVGAISRPGDSFEREADRVSRQVMRTPELQLERACPCGGGCPACRNPHPRLRVPHPSHAVGDAASSGIHEASRSSGRPLDRGTRAFMEPRFGRSFARVRVHADRHAAAAARSLNARAFTVGSDIYFGAGEFGPESTRSRGLLAHELVHVVQQQTGAAPMIARASLGEMWGAFWGAGPVDAYRASKLADEALKAAQQTGLPGLHNGPADAWRHCYWNCRMTQVIGEGDAADIAENHEEHGGNATAERMMDTWNNEEGRKCSGDCDLCCQSKLDAGKLWVLDGGKVSASKPTPRTSFPSGGKYEKY